MDRLADARLHRRHGLGPGPRVRPLLDRWTFPEADVLAARAAGRVPVLTIPGAPDGPRVLVTCDRGPAEDGAGEVRVCRSYVDAVVGVGATPLLVPPGERDVDALFDGADALVVTGGSFDIHPHHYGAAVAARLDRTDDARTLLELALCRAALAADLPVLGVCGGLQALAVAAGGTLIQDLPATPTHEQPTDPATPWHRVALTGGLAELLGPHVAANSTHHQAVDDPGAAFLVEGRTDAGVIEAVRAPGRRFAVGVQWHPERLGDLRLYAALVHATRR